MNELQVATASGLTLYAVLLGATGQAWNGSAFETLAGANWTTYALPLTEAAAGVYFGGLPAVGAGAYSYVVYERAGGSPATTDKLRGGGSLLWDGAQAARPALASDMVASLVVTEAQALAAMRGELVVVTHHALHVTFTSTSLSDFATATLAFGLKARRADADVDALLLVRSDTGLTVAGGADGTAADGAISVTGSAGAWEVTVTVAGAATALLAPHKRGFAELKNLTTDLPIWTGDATIERGVVQTLS